jgi:hypothetical protein
MQLCPNNYKRIHTEGRYVVTLAVEIGMCRLEGQSP